MIKALSDKFFHRFLDGDLSEIIDFLHGRPQFMLNLRGDHVTIYYKGMPIIEIHENDENDVFWLTRFAYMASAEKFDTNFEEKISSSDFLKKPLYKLCVSDIGWWFQLLTDIACGIDKFAIDIPTSGIGDEQKHQDILHNIVMENNAYPEFNATDYFIIDIEYANPDVVHQDDKNATNMNAVALHWLRDNKSHAGLTFIEFKTGKESMNPVKTTLNNKVYEDIEKAIAQMCKLYLISMPGVKDIATIEPIKIDKDKTQKIAIPINLNQKHSALLEQISKMSELDDTDFRIATASFMGYGLYDENMLTLDEFKKIFN